MTSDEAFLASFEEAGVPKSEWTHRAHVRLAFVLLSRLPFDEAVRRLREGIPRLNRAHGVPNTDTGGYHETLTVAWAGLVLERLDDDALDFEGFIARHPELLTKELVLEHYSRERLLSVEARRGLVPPDLRPLPGCEEAA